MKTASFVFVSCAFFFCIILSFLFFLVTNGSLSLSSIVLPMKSPLFSYLKGGSPPGCRCIFKKKRFFYSLWFFGLASFQSWLQLQQLKKTPQYFFVSNSRFITSTVLSLLLRAEPTVKAIFFFLLQFEVIYYSCSIRVTSPLNKTKRDQRIGEKGRKL